MSTPTWKPAPCTPSVRLFFNEHGVAEDLRVIVNKGSKNTKKYNEFQNLVHVTVDTQTKELQGISVDLAKLGNTAAINSLIILLAKYELTKELIARSFINKELEVLIKLIGEQKVNDELNKLKRTYQKNLGPFYSLIITKFGGHYYQLVKDSFDAKNYNTNFFYITNVTKFSDEFDLKNNHRVQIIIPTILKVLIKLNLITKFADYLLANKIFDGSWDLVFDSFRHKPAMPLEEKAFYLKAWMTIDSTDEFKFKVLDELSMTLSFWNEFKLGKTDIKLYKIFADMLFYAKDNIKTVDSTQNDILTYHFQQSTSLLLQIAEQDGIKPKDIDHRLEEIAY